MIGSAFVSCKASEIRFGPDPSHPEGYISTQTPCRVHFLEVCALLGRHLHIDLGRRVSSNHVLNCEVTARMPILPAIEPQHALLIYHDGLAGSDEAFDLAPREYTQRIGHGGIMSV